MDTKYPSSDLDNFLWNKYSVQSRGGGGGVGVLPLPNLNYLTSNFEGLQQVKEGLR